MAKMATRASQQKYREADWVVDSTGHWGPGGLVPGPGGLVPGPWGLEPDPWDLVPPCGSQKTGPQALGGPKTRFQTLDETHPKKSPGYILYPALG